MSQHENAFGLRTPQGALEVIEQARARQRETFNKRARPSEGETIGQLIGEVFGPVIHKALDTRKARKAEAVRLMKEEGMDEKTARQQAKESIDFEFADVRKAKRVQEASTEAQRVMSDIAPIVGPQRAKAVGLLTIAGELRKVGMNDKATELSQQAALLLQEDDERLLATRKIKAQVRGQELTNEQIGKTAFIQNQGQRELLLAELQDPELSENARERLSVQIGELDSKIEKDSTIIGRTLQDVGNDPVAMRKLFEEFTTDLVLLNGLDIASDALVELSTYEATFLARGEARFRGFIEDKFGIEPDESSKDFINRIVKAQGIAVLVAAKIRHSLTGAQMSQFEIEFLEPFLPAPGDSRAKMQAKIAAVRAYTQMSADLRLSLIQSKTLGQFISGQESLFGDRATVPKTRTERAEEAVFTVEELIKAGEGKKAD